MTRYLLDVNALVAVGFGQHELHGAAPAWIAGLPAQTRLATCPITELGFARILQQVPQYRVAIADARTLLGRLKSNRKRPFDFLVDDHSIDQLPAWVKTGKQTTDGHLLQLAQAHGAELATFDTGIPGAFVIPSP